MGSRAEHFAVVGDLSRCWSPDRRRACPAAPISRVAFAMITGAWLRDDLHRPGEWPFAAASALFTAVAVHGSIEAGRIYLSARIAEVGVAEKDEVVSLLLREFQENEADWLWQIDTNRGSARPARASRSRWAAIRLDRGRFVRPADRRQRHGKAGSFRRACTTSSSG
jgi:hypothetical protein